MSAAFEDSVGRCSFGGTDGCPGSSAETAAAAVASNDDDGGSSWATRGSRVPSVFSWPLPRHTDAALPFRGQTPLQDREEELRS